MVDNNLPDSDLLSSRDIPKNEAQPENLFQPAEVVDINRLPKPPVPGKLKLKFNIVFRNGLIA